MPQLTACPNCGSPARLVDGVVRCGICSQSPAQPAGDSRTSDGEADEPKEVFKSDTRSVQVDAATYMLLNEKAEIIGPLGKTELDQQVALGLVTAKCQIWRDGTSQRHWAGDFYPQLGLPSPEEADHLDHSFTNEKLVALLLNILFPGLGQITLGRTKEGVGMLVCWVLLILISFCTLGISLFFAFMLWITAILDVIYRPTFQKAGD